MEEEVRSEVDAAMNKYLGIIERETLLFREFVRNTWNSNPSMTELKFMAHGLRTELECAYEEFDKLTSLIE